MNMTAFWVIVALCALDVVFCFLDLVYRIVTEEDRHLTWKERAIGDLIEGLLWLLLLLWLFWG